jgi:hypothetical protein
VNAWWFESKSQRIEIGLKKRWEIWLEWKSRFEADFTKKPVGYQLALLRSFRDAVRIGSSEEGTILP